MPNTLPIGFAYADMNLDGTQLANSPQVAFPAGATNQTTGFNWIPSASGPPTGVPANRPTGNVPLYYDLTNNRLYVHNGTTWRYATTV